VVAWDLLVLDEAGAVEKPVVSTGSWLKNRLEAYAVKAVSLQE
jgi:hypothetical protein